jgi:hypothetical protein
VVSLVSFPTLPRHCSRGLEGGDGCLVVVVSVVAWLGRGAFFWLQFVRADWGEGTLGKRRPAILLMASKGQFGVFSVNASGRVRQYPIVVLQRTETSPPPPYVCLLPSL